MSWRFTHCDENADAPIGSGDRYGHAKQALGAPRNVRLQSSGFFLNLIPDSPAAPDPHLLK
jgi:hypothetical protein